MYKSYLSSGNNLLLQYQILEQILRVITNDICLAVQLLLLLKDKTTRVDFVSPLSFSTSLRRLLLKEGILVRFQNEVRTDTAICHLGSFFCNGEKTCV